MSTNNGPAPIPGAAVPACPVCHRPLSVRLAQGRRSKKAFLMLVCAADGRHLRGFISDKQFVSAVVARLEAQQEPKPPA